MRRRNGATREMTRMLARPGRRQFALAVSLVALVAATPTFAQQEWQPFKERDERSMDRGRRAPKAAVPVGPQDEGPVPPSLQPGNSVPAFTPPPKGAVERVELAPLEPLPGQGAQPNAAPTDPALRPKTPSGQLSSADPSPPQLTQRSALGGEPAARSAGDVLPPDLWRGVDMKLLETLIQPLAVPPRSVALHGLWRKLMTADATPPAGGQGATHFTALQLEALYRSGLIGLMQERLDRIGNSDDPLMASFRVRRALAAADTDTACNGAKQLTSRRAGLPKALKGEAHVLAGYCAAVGGNAAAAGLAAELAREEEVDAPLALQALDVIAAPQGAPKPKVQLPQRMIVLDYRLLELAGLVDPAEAMASAEPALLYALSQTAGTSQKTALAAAEGAAALHALMPAQLAEVYRRVAVNGATSDPMMRRAALFKQLSSDEDPRRQLATAKQMLDDARRSGLSFVLARLLAGELASLQPSPDLGPAAAIAAELALAAGDYERARQFAAASPQASIWAPLAELADPQLRGITPSALAVLEDGVRRGRFTAEPLHRLATVLDALDVNIPLPVWEAASRTPQPNSGHLPETGILPQMQDAAAKREVGRTALLVMRSIGPNGPDTTHLIALADSLRALRRAGLEADARLLALEALFLSWPRN